MRSNLALVFSLFLLMSSGVAEARPLRHVSGMVRHTAGLAPECNVTMPCDLSGLQTSRVRNAFLSRSPNEYSRRSPRIEMTATSGLGDRIVSGRPAGCPNAYCGCAASLRVFGHVVPGLNLAANWLRFPRTAPAPGMVAARRGHVFVLEQQVGGDVWMAYDGNSGGHATRIHARSLRGYTVVNPHAA
jgi:hypothetical protein